MPRISVLTPIYNTRPVHLCAMMESVLNQTFTDFEFIILNNSPENKELKNIVKSYKDPRIVYAENEKNMGISASRNQLIEMARGEYLAVCDHDDISAPQRFEKQSAFLDAHPAVGVIGCAVRWMTAKPYVSFYPKENMDIKKKLMHNCHLSHPGAMIKKSVLTRNNIRYEEQYSPAEDYMLWCRLIEFTQFHGLQDILLEYRVHDSRASVLQAQRMHDAMQEIRLYVRNKYPALYQDYLDDQQIFIRLLWYIPILKIRKDTGNVQAWLFNFIPVLKIKRRWRKKK